MPTMTTSLNPASSTSATTEFTKSAICTLVRSAGLQRGREVHRKDTEFRCLSRQFRDRGIPTIGGVRAAVYEHQAGQCILELNRPQITLIAKEKAVHRETYHGT